MKGSNSVCLALKSGFICLLGDFIMTFVCNKIYFWKISRSEKRLIAAGEEGQCEEKKYIF